jgi:hypothetical protein
VRGAIVAAAALAAVVLAGCGGPPVTQSRSVGSFDRLDVSGALDVTVVQGARTGVTVRGRKDVLGRVDTDVVDGTLHIGVHDRGIVIGSDPLDSVRVTVTAPRLGDVKVSGQADIDLGDVRADTLRFAVSGTGDLRARGRVDALDVQIHGAADANLGDLEARTARVEIHGAADIRLDVSDRLDVEIHGAGDVSYPGDPEVTKRINGAGDVTHVAG